MSVKKEVVQSIIDSLVEAKEFVVNPQHYSDGAVIRQVNDDGTVIEISAKEFWERARGGQKESEE